MAERLPASNISGMESCTDSHHEVKASFVVDRMGSIEQLQQKQTEVQAKLNEASIMSVELNRRKRFQDGPSSGDTHNPADQANDKEHETDDDDNELLEFQQIENELRISELIRQLNHIQEELRLKLYERLLKNTNSELKNHTRTIDTFKPPDIYSTNKQQTSVASNQPTSLSTSYSSCSDSGISASTLTTTSPSTQTSPPPTSLTTHDKITKSLSSSHSQSIAQSDQNQELTAATQLRESQQNVTTSSYSKDQQAPSVSIISNGSDIQDAPLGLNKNKNSTTNYNITDNLSKDLKRLNMCNSCFGDSSSGSVDPVDHSNHVVVSTSSTLKHSSNLNDLEKIDEDDEYLYPDDANSFRAVYEEKISPIYANSSARNGNVSTAQSRLFSSPNSTPKSLDCTVIPQGGHDRIPIINSTNLSNSILESLGGNSSSQSDNKKRFNQTEVGQFMFNNQYLRISNDQSNINRPLTLYMPRPDEDINLVEHIQVLGHDMSIISGDLKVDTTVARGYLWKRCSNSHKKWLKRYFYFDRKNKLLTYYENESDLVKRYSEPKNCIPFEIINDVYVDHRMSSLGTPKRLVSAASSPSMSSSTSSVSLSATCKKKNFIFVLATESRKFHLATCRAETMRAWIDILYTAARANDYLFEQSFHSIGQDNCT